MEYIIEWENVSARRFNINSGLFNIFVIIINH